MSLAVDPRGYWASLTGPERAVFGLMAASVGALAVSVVVGWLAPAYFLYLVGLGGMYALLSFGLNAHWGFTGLINFSVAAFFGIGAYGAALATAGNSPLAGGLNPLVGLAVAIVLAVVLAVAIGIPTLRLRADYLAIASLGLAEVVRLVFLNERQWTNGSAGLRGIPHFFQGWPVLDGLPSALPGIRMELLPGTAVVFGTPFYRALLNVALVLAFVAVSYAVLRRVHRSPWGRVLGTIRSDEDLAKALGKNTYLFKMQVFVLGSVVMALAGVFYTHLNLYVAPGVFDPITTFYVWVAVMLGGSGSNRGALLGGFVIVAVREGTRFVDDLGAIPIEPGPLRLLVIGLLIVALMRFRPQGLLPPQRELIWPGAARDASAAGDGPRTDSDAPVTDGGVDRE